MCATLWLQSSQTALEVKKFLNYNQDQKSSKILFIIYAKMKSILETIQVYCNNPEKSFASKITRYK